MNKRVIALMQQGMTAEDAHKVVHADSLLTKREQFAMAAMQGLLASGARASFCAKGAVNLADELIKQLDGGE